jgi:hypothetical protein
VIDHLPNKPPYGKDSIVGKLLFLGSSVDLYLLR